MIDEDLGYYQARATEERKRALKAATPEASAAHRTLADMYQRRLDALAGRRTAAQ